MTTERVAVDVREARERFERTEPASESDIARDVVRGIDGPPRRLRTKGDIEDGPRRSSSGTSISADCKRESSRWNINLTIADLLERPSLQQAEAPRIPYLHPPPLHVLQDTCSSHLDLLPTMRTSGECDLESRFIHLEQNGGDQDLISARSS